MSSLYWLVTDETNVNIGLGTFFIYGGLVFNPEQLLKAHNIVSDTRKDYGFAPQDQFKFDTHSRPKGMEPSKWTAAKAEVLRRAVDAEIKMLAYIVHHNIAAGADPEARVEYALNAVLAHYDKVYLAEHMAAGVVCIDRLENKFGYGYLKRRFQEPLSLPDGRSPSLDRIVHYSMSCDGASHISSLVDIALGGFRYCVNAAMGKGTDSIAKSLFPSVAKLMWSKKVGDTHFIRNYGLITYPKVVKSLQYKTAYEDMLRTLANYAVGG